LSELERREPKNKLRRPRRTAAMLEDLDFSIDVIDRLTEMTDNAGVIAPA